MYMQGEGMEYGGSDDEEYEDGHPYAYGPHTYGAEEVR